MARENSFSDEDGRSLTPDVDEDAQGGPPPMSPTYSTPPQRPELPAASQKTPLSPSKKSFKSHIHHHDARATTSGLAPKDKFRVVVKRVMAMQRSSTVIASRGAGAEPGVDPRRASADVQYGGIKQDCVIELTDYSSIRSSFGRMTNKEFVNFMNDPQASQKDAWVKVRWINIAGLSWDVIKALTIKYDLHPLAVEDVFHSRSQTRSKVDYYSKHLFIRACCHELVDSGDPSGESAAFGSTLAEDFPRSSSPLPMTEDEKENGNRNGDFGEDEKTVFGDTMTSRKALTARKRRRIPIFLRSNLPDVESPTSDNIFSRMARADPFSEARQRRKEQQAILDTLKKGDRVNVQIWPMYIFLLRDGTVISIHSNPFIALTKPITYRIQQRDTLLRTSADPSLLVHSLLDLIVDKALEVIDEYHVKIMQFEREILLRPKITTVRNLHILSGDLILHRRTLEPLKTVIYGLRRYDLDRAIAVVDTSQKPDAQVVGYMSHKTKIYLADVHDHMEYILSSLDMFAGIGQNLIDYAFNIKSYEMNEVMRRLTLATIIFLPLTLLTGYFGMNFDFMWSLRRSDLFFWELAIPIMLTVIPLFMMGDIERAVHYIQKKVLARKVVKGYKEE